ncbi:sigma-70 family RNA polymerase sigma factor [Vibrio sp.]|uniref:Sigma-70 family RNA polymerase sigma factor n=1 Tax=Vibrio viridaestus TaxID=2487322 RepID=A0A3N9TJQ8_9VIBR|nr:sigma-70 family RNA polymerase sigma factor [Vibrio viridaestus]MDC0610679.1 sigma-70 family RNA polymerase sigma factor [Vibrio sp.]RQW63805.1 sigma-70 family RNA polymerase sigma factor [Vibrio viridaestus]
MNASVQALTPEHSELFQDKVFMHSLRQKMLKFALIQIKNEQLAEDAVQEALISAYQHIDKFQRKAALQTWIFSILKNKLIDLLRKENRHSSIHDLEEGKGLSGDELMEFLFDQRGHWHKEQRPVHWSDPDDDIENDDFWKIFDACLNHMPERYSRYFMMREFLELETDEICQNESLSVNQLNVTLYRARLKLRECLENNWYLQGVQS